MRDLIVLIHVGHPNDLESAQSSRATFATFGYRLEEIGLNDPNLKDTFETLMRLRASQIFCFMSANYYALGITGMNGELLHRLTGIPLVIMQHDHPLYFLSKQTPALNGSIIFTPGEGSRRFIASHYPGDVTAIANTGSLPQIETAVPDFEQFMRRKNVILAPMNLSYSGTNIDGAWKEIKELPEPRRSFAIRLVEIALTDSSTPLHELAAAAGGEMKSPKDVAAYVGDQLLVLNFLKLWRRTVMVRALIELPILISSEYVPADLEFKYPHKFTLFTTAQTIPLYSQYRFTLNAHPLITHLLHDRILTATAVNSVIITDASAAVLQYFADDVDAIFFDYNAPDAMAARIDAYLKDPAKAYALTVRAAELRKASGYFNYRDGYAKLIDLIANHWSGEPRVAGEQNRS